MKKTKPGGLILALLCVISLLVSNCYASGAAVNPLLNAPATVTQTSLVKVESKKSGQITVHWKKNTSGKGYEIQYARDKNLKKDVKTVRIKDNKTTHKTIKELQSGKTYYVRIRTINGKKHAKWSGRKKVKVAAKSKKSEKGSTDSSDIVYITDTGEKYHRGNCRTLKSRHEISRQEAIDRGYTPCKVCNPG